MKRAFSIRRLKLVTGGGFGVRRMSQASLSGVSTLLSFNLRHWDTAAAVMLSGSFFGITGVILPVASIDCMNAQSDAARVL